MSDAYEAGSYVQALTWKDGVTTPGADFMQALGMCVEDNVIEDDPGRDDSDADITAFGNVLVVTEEDADQVVAEDEVEHTNNAIVDDDDQRLTQDDIDIFRENDSVIAA